MNIQNKEQWHHAFIEACEKGLLDDVRQLCQKQYLDLGWADIHASGEAGFHSACNEGHLEVVKYLLTSQELLEAGRSFANVHELDEYGFRWTCANGHLNVVRYLTTSKELKEAGHTFANVHAQQGAGLISACRLGHIDMIRFLLTSKELKETGEVFNIHEQEDGFHVACQREQWNVIQWLIMDYEIEKTRYIESIIQDNPRVQDYFLARQARSEMAGIQKEMQGCNLNYIDDSDPVEKREEAMTRKIKKL